LTRRIRAFEEADFSGVHDICVRAFTSIHEGFEQALGPEIFAREYPTWQARYADDIRALVAAAPATLLHVIEESGVIIGFVATILHADRKCGEIGLNAIDPTRQGEGAGKEMYAFALQSLKERGAAYAYVGTGADAAHTPARKAYEAMGFDKVVPSNHYYRKL
jgi:ribosomal protein S18 acetylase RimI-like enzyme